MPLRRPTCCRSTQFLKSGSERFDEFVLAGGLQVECTSLRRLTEAMGIFTGYPRLPTQSLAAAQSCCICIHDSPKAVSSDYGQSIMKRQNLIIPSEETLLLNETRWVSGGEPMISRITGRAPCVSLFVTRSSARLSSVWVIDAHETAAAYGKLVSKMLQDLLLCRLVPEPPGCTFLCDIALEISR